MDIDAVIIDVEFEVASRWKPYNHFVCFRFVDTAPENPRLKNALYELENHEDVEVVDYQYSETPITEKTNFLTSHQVSLMALSINTLVYL
jgi:hypothetical protein